jgi:hypothetical protein
MGWPSIQVWFISGYAMAVYELSQSLWQAVDELLR